MNSEQLKKYLKEIGMEFIPSKNRFKGTESKYYVYVRPGHIEYFDNLQDAQELAEYYGVTVGEMTHRPRL